MQGIDIRPLKMRLRGEIKAWRRALEPGWKAAADEKICARVLALREYAACSTLLTYVSLPIEVDTLCLISRAFADGKKVAAPRCVEGTHEMEFYEISSMDDLARQTFGVLEPVRERCRLLTDFSGSVCLVPALAYDRAGYRLGYGAGYYDRFLSVYPGPKIGLVYAQNLRRSLWKGRYDVPVDLIVTEARLFVPQAAGAERKKKK
ncbi:MULTISPECIES: 5-formyltetrahydrofolate cyclo-ligase [Anaerotruncus]|uniref:5-formyltetrahydrofolate cyclo-ligase n=2 Tax=Anaerotruncus TaxID=244127 RepID=A0A498D019_9FIRM|nr:MULTISPECIES: 5-formyltetrahydrofolate cyclo-ligase [Anaerotruncus]MBC3938923.1 5-formyltetrahydrofolate cyclo-ligase [Anaerotruncus massiliensis (ex Togo et al. 2019)]MCQ4896198.1 5-formyltetrahydrofolate cyclo-ligase [Anaerotruncus sp. DFI.9.16]RLL10625.1 5-formyltetrahydrofolate cyclo-ligase [Anaerotruncus massiliensis (ex Liu et al. 2021)]